MKLGNFLKLDSLDSLDSKTIIVLGIIVVAFWLMWNQWNQQTRENFFFYNIKPTEDIDPEYLNPNEDRHNYYNWMRVGDIHGVDLNCNNVTKCDLLRWIYHDDPSVIHEHVYRYDPSVDINNPLDAPRVFKMLLRNLPQKHRHMSILRKCLPRGVRVA